jgi:mono/diheme cytochrome c family protein
VKIVLAVFVIGVFVCSFVMLAFTQDTAKNSAGDILFTKNCALCHADGGNEITPDKPLKKSLALKELATFVALIRVPNQPMPPFDSSQISDKQAKELYDYILKKVQSTWK